MEKLTFFDDDLEDFDELMELSEEETRPGTAPAILLPPIAPTVCASLVNNTANTSPDIIEAPPKLPETPLDQPIKSTVTPFSGTHVSTPLPTEFKCRVCGGRHPLRFCDSFLAMTLEKRLRMVVMHGYCSRCLAQSHRTKNCSSNGQCRKCKGGHHVLLHSGPTTAGKQKNVRPTRQYTPYQRPLSRPRPRSEVSPYVDDADGTNPLALSVLPGLSVVSLSPSLVVHIKSNMTSVPVRAVLDPCSKYSQVCYTLVKSLHLPISWMEKVPWCRITVASAYDPEQRIALSARVCNLDKVFTPSESVPEKLKESYLGLPLADPQFFKRGRVALVFGPELYARIVTNRVQTTPGIPVAHYTIFGWVLSGIASM